ncbi:hypothetical protein H6F67_16665 [Microcoleus sp. FACHB-1515]|uniref:hypothetical protein n=1 Tax=Cyanophyceae TaxID=3028117 RepID=UPI00168323EF|nr:hypothetical protein [Microcoleus sp. FACHB-1515]MBD2091478.1 hypothetical protein [Microcoleus sp. FACHB-1515]
MTFLQSIAIALLICLSCAWPAAADAPICRSVNGQEICILSIKRSAKNYWEYRATVSIDGQARSWRSGTVSIEKYNCRDRIRIRQNGRSVPFEPQGVGELLCRLAHQKRR